MNHGGHAPELMHEVTPTACAERPALVHRSRTLGRATTLAAVNGVLPEHRYPQTEITAAFAEVCGGRPMTLIRPRRGNIRLMHRLRTDSAD